MQFGRTNLSGTVRNTQPVKFQSGKVRNRCCELLITGRAKMRTADNRVNPRLIEILLKPLNSIDQPGMCAAEYDHETFGCFDGEGGVIGKRVDRPRIASIRTRDQLRVAAFLRRPADNLTAEMNPGSQFAKMR